METPIVYWGYIEEMENRMETTIVYWGYIGEMENKTENTIVYWGYIGEMENRMETTIVYWGYTGDNGKWNFRGPQREVCTACLSFSESSTGQVLPTACM